MTNEPKRYAANIGLVSGGANLPVRHFFVNSGFVARPEFSAENPARTPSRRTLAVSLRNGTPKMVNKEKYDEAKYC
jgi:hypothetical protein